MTCKSCAERRKALREKREAKRLARKHFQVAAIGAVLSVSEAAGKVLGVQDEDLPSSKSTDKDISGYGTSLSFHKPAGMTIRQALYEHFGEDENEERSTPVSDQSGREAHEE